MEYQLIPRNSEISNSDDVSLTVTPSISRSERKTIPWYLDGCLMSKAIIFVVILTWIILVIWQVLLTVREVGVSYILVILNFAFDKCLRPNAYTRSAPLLILSTNIIGLNDIIEIGIIESPYREILSWSAIIIILFGIGLRAYAMRINQFFTRTLRIGEGQFIVTE
ncbi:3246_t:CDS:2, partial [Scutellospora calospora]